MKLFNYIFIVFITILPSYGEIVEEIFFKVNDEIITKIDYEDQIRIEKQNFLLQSQKIPYDFEKTVISNMIINLLIQQETQRKGINVTDLDVSNQINSIIQINNFNSIDNLKAYLTAQGLTWDYFFKSQKINIYKENLISRVITIKEPQNQELINYYEKNKEAEFKIKTRLPKVALIHLRKDPGMTYSEILKLNSTGKQIEKELNKGADFSMLAKQYSDDFKSKNIGGDSGWRTAEEFSQEPQLWEAIDSLELGQHTPLLPSKNGFYIFKVIEEKQEGYIPFERARKDIQLSLIQIKRKEAYDNKIKQIIRDAVIIKKTQLFNNFTFK